MTKKECYLCKKSIDEKKDEWFENKLFKKGVFDSVIYFHRECYKKFHKEKFKEEYEKNMKLLTPVIKKLMGREEVIC